MGAGEDILRRMGEFEATVLNRLDEIDRRVERLAQHLGADRPAGAANSGTGGRVATAAAIRGKYGDPEIGKDPPRWEGEAIAPAYASQCPPDYLEAVADFFDWKADNPRPGKEKFAPRERERAGYCRRWAIEIREGRHKPGERPVTRLAPPPGEDTSGTTWTSGNMAPPPTGMAPPPSDDTGGLLPPPPDDGADPYDDSMPF
jgi:hypothetical protein